MTQHSHITRMGIAWTLAATFAIVVLPHGAAADESNVEDTLGLTEYEIACMSCHGLNGTGDGPKARTLSMMPADLTRIAQRNGGTFPRTAIYDLIDGRGVIPSHGRRDMPIWGERYRKTGDPGEDPSVVDKRARAVIEALVDYIESIQQN